MGTVAAAAGLCWHDDAVTVVYLLLWDLRGRMRPDGVRQSQA